MDLPKAQRRAVLLVLQDVHERAMDLSDGTGVTERCARYWVPDGTLSRGVAELVFPFVYGALGAQHLSPSQARALGFPVRTPEPGRGRGDHWLLPRRGRALAEAALEDLRELGYEPEAPRTHYRLGDPQDLALHPRGQRLFLRCPHHDDRDPSALLNPSGVVYCFGCARVVGLATVDGSTARYRPVLGVVDPNPLPRPASAPSAQPRAPQPLAEPEESTSTSTPLGWTWPHEGDFTLADGPLDTAPPPPTPTRRGFLWALPISASNQPYLVNRVLEIGAPGPPPRLQHGGRPTGVLIYEGEEEFQRLPQSLGLVLGRRYGDEPVGRRGRYGLARAYSSSMDLLDVLRTADRNTGENAYIKALNGVAIAEQHHTDPRHYLPDLYVGLDHHTWGAYHQVRGRRKEGREGELWVLQPTDFSPRCTSWVGVDVDGIEGWAGGEDALAAAHQIRETLEKHPAFTGRMALVKTSSSGAQVVAELAATRWAPQTFYRNEDVRKMLHNLDRMVVGALHAHGVVGGEADPSVHAAGRLVRRPGPRVDKRGNPAVARLIFATP